MAFCPDIALDTSARTVILIGRWSVATTHRVPIPTRGKAGRNHLNEEITPLLPTGIGKQYSQTISNLGHAALLRRCELPL